MTLFVWGRHSWRACILNILHTKKVVQPSGTTILLIFSTSQVQLDNIHSTMYLKDSPTKKKLSLSSGNLKSGA